jgi:hypothetical protein
VIRRLAVIALVIVAAAAVYLFFVRDSTVTATLYVPQPAATLGAAAIGGGEDTVVVDGDGRPIPWYRVGEATELPALPEVELPENGRLAGPMLEQARVLGAAPAELRPYLERSYYGEGGVDVILDSGIELRFGDASQAQAKWRAAVAVLADPTIVALDYVDLHAPSRPAKEGESHVLPPLP